VGYAATPGTNTYKLNVIGTARISSTLTANSFATLSNQTISGSSSGNWTFTNSGGGGWYIEWIQNSATAMTLSTENSLLLGTTSSVSSSILTLASTAKGVLLPRMTTAQKNAISTPATSLLLYDTDLATFQYYSGSAWTSLGGGGGISGSGTAGQVTYWSGTSAVTGSNNLFWDNTNGRLGIGTSSPQRGLHIHTPSTGLVSLQLTNTTSGTTNLDGFQIYGDGTNYVFGNFENGYAAYLTNALERMRIFAGGNIAINSTTDSNYRLDINGTGATAGALRVTGGNVQFGSATGLNWDNTNGRLGIGTSSPSYSLEVSGQVVASKNADAFNRIMVSNTTIGTSAFVVFSATSDASSGELQFGKYGSNKTAYAGINAKDGYIYNSVGGDIAISNSYTSGAIKLFAGGSTTAQFTLKANGRINMSSLPTSATGLSAGDLWNNSGVINII